MIMWGLEFWIYFLQPLKIQWIVQWRNLEKGLDKYLQGMSDQPGCGGCIHIGLWASASNKRISKRATWQLGWRPNCRDRRAYETILSYAISLFWSLLRYSLPNMYLLANSCFTAQKISHCLGFLLNKFYNFCTDLGMLWYGVTGVSFNPADPAEVMLNTGTTAPLLSDHPRPLVPTPVSYSEPTATQQTQMVWKFICKFSLDMFLRI